MRMRSTGLGKTELVGDIAGVTMIGSILVLNVHTTSPVRWHVRAAIQRKDILKLAKAIFSFALLKYLFCTLIKSSKEPETF